MKKFLLYLILISITLLACGKRIELIEFGDKNQTNRVLIATQQSDFKDSIVSKIMELLKEDNCYIKVIDLNDWENEIPEDYKSIIIIGAVKMGKLNSNADKFIETIQQKEKIILLASTNSGKWKSKMEIDSITSASEIIKVDSIAQNITDKIREHLISSPE